MSHPACLEDFLLARHSAAIKRILAEPLAAPAVHVSVLEVLDWSASLGMELLDGKHQGHRLDASLIKAQSQLIGHRSPEQDGSALANEADSRAWTVKPKARLRLESLPLTPEAIFPRHLPGISTHNNKLVTVAGIVVRTGSVRMRQSGCTFECSWCGHRQWVLADEQQYGAISKPAVCAGRAEDGSQCRSAKFTRMLEQAEGKEDYQEIRVQESPNVSSLFARDTVEAGVVPRSISVVLLGEDLVDRVKAGDVVHATGWIQVRWRPVKHGQKCQTELFLLATSLLAAVAGCAPACSPFDFRAIWRPDSTMQTRDSLVGSFCPDVHGMLPVKLAVLLTVLSGSPLAAGEPQRSNGHLLLVGDPGTAKSRFLHAAARITRRSVMTTGCGSTNAGLTVAAVRESSADHSGWALEAGALVMADGGVCCIDEFGGLRESDRTAIHEAMEQQTLSVAKAGMVCRLSTRCSIIAACNSKDRYDGDHSITANVALASPLLSRFDLILVLVDGVQGAQWDCSLADHMLSGTGSTRPAWSEEQLRAYIGHARTRASPAMTDRASLLLQRYYQKQRQQDLRDAARTTIRLLESLIRVARAHAKLCLSEAVRLEDAAVAIRLMDMSLSVRGLSARSPGELYAAVLFDGCADQDEALARFIDELVPVLGINPEALQARLHPSQH